MPGPEAKIERYLSDQVKKRGGMTWKMAPTRSGAPDRAVALPGGRLHLVEVKKPGGRVSDVQKVFHHQLSLRDVEVHVVYSKEDVDALLHRLDAWFDIF